jgi:hypothetical protein
MDKRHRGEAITFEEIIRIREMYRKGVRWKVIAKRMGRSENSCLMALFRRYPDEPRRVQMGIRTHDHSFTVYLPMDIDFAVDKLTRDMGITKAHYIRQLVKADLERRQKDEIHLHELQR